MELSCLGLSDRRRQSKNERGDCDANPGNRHHADSYCGTNYCYMFAGKQKNNAGSEDDLNNTDRVCLRSVYRYWTQYSNVRSAKTRSYNGVTSPFSTQEFYRDNYVHEKYQWRSGNGHSSR